MVIDINIPRLVIIKDELQTTIWGKDAGVYVAHWQVLTPINFRPALSVKNHSSSTL